MEKINGTIDCDKCGKNDHNTSLKMTPGWVKVLKERGKYPDGRDTTWNHYCPDCAKVCNQRNPLYRLIDELKRVGTISEIDGNWHCQKCDGVIEIDWFTQELECLGCDDMDGDTLEFQVVVGNIGTVVETNDRETAIKTFQDYVELSKDPNSGKASGEQVNLLQNGVVIDSHEGTQESE